MSDIESRTESVTGSGVRLGMREISGARPDAKATDGVSRDYIRTYLGLMGSGKTTRALHDVWNSQRLLILSPTCPHVALHEIPSIYDTENYLKDFSAWIQRYPRLRIEKRAFPSEIFQHLSTLRGYVIMLDDLPALKTNGSERAEFDSFIRTVRYNGNRVVLTAHRAKGDISPLVRHIGTSFYWVGAGTRSRRELDSLYELTNFPISFNEFCDVMARNQKYQVMDIRRAG